MKLEGCLPVIRMTATILIGRITNRVKVHGPKGGLERHGRGPVQRRDPSVSRRMATGRRAK